MERFFDEIGWHAIGHSTRRTARASTAPGGWRCESAFAVPSTLNCRRPPRTTQSCSRSERKHSFPLDEVFRYLNSKSVREVLVQALLDAPNVYDSLALECLAVRWPFPRQRGGRRLARPLQRMESENLLAAVFPDQLACLENVPGDREVADHPLVNQTISDCLTESDGHRGPGTIAAGY